MPEVTIVMPAYNVEEYIAKSIDSILLQEFKNWELIIVNDGSTDNTGEIIQKYADLYSRIKVITQLNQGVSVARNVGLNCAKGVFVSFLDADDFLTPDYIEKMIKPLRDNIADITFCKYREVDGLKVVNETSSNICGMPNGSFIQHVEQRVSGAKHNMAFMYRLSLLNDFNIRFFPRCRFGEDAEFVLKATSLGEVQYVPEYLYQYVCRQESVSRVQLLPDIIFDEISAYHRLQDFLLTNTKIKLYSEYVAYVQRILESSKNRLRKSLWGLLVEKRWNEVMIALRNYEERYGEKFNVETKGFP